MADEKKAKKTADKKAGKDEKKKSTKNPFKAIGSFFKSVRSEGKKVVWPKAAEVWKNTLVVLVVIIIVGLAIYAVDFGLTTGMKAIKNAAVTTTTTEAVEEETEAEDYCLYSSVSTPSGLSPGRLVTISMRRSIFASSESTSLASFMPSSYRETASWRSVSGFERALDISSILESFCSNLSLSAILHLLYVGKDSSV